MRRGVIVAGATAVLVMLTALPRASAATIVYTLEGFTDGAGDSLTGSFDFDGSTYTNVDITSTYASATPGRTYYTSDVNLSVSNYTGVGLVTPADMTMGGDFYWDLGLLFAPFEGPYTGLSPSNGPIPTDGLETYFDYNMVFENYQVAWSGYVVPTASCGPFSCTPIAATPLPAALPMFAAGLGVIGLFGWRRRRPTRAVAANTLTY
jgi:hypothetical protein